MSFTHLLFVGAQVEASGERAASGRDGGAGAQLFHLKRGREIGGGSGHGRGETKGTEEERWGNNLDEGCTAAITSGGNEGGGCLKAENGFNDE